MKKAYNTNWVENLYTQRLAGQWLNEKLISPEQNVLVREDFPQELYLPRIFVKIGLFIFTVMACCFFTGFISLLFIERIDSFITILSLVSFVAFVIALELMIKSRRLFHSGIDNALLYSSLIALLLPLILHFENRLEVWQYCLIALVPLTIATYRYGDVFLAACIFLAIFTLLANLMLKYALGKVLLPFAIMIVAAAIYRLVSYLNDRYYHQCRKVLEAMALLTFYLGSNYYVVREVNAALLSIQDAVSPQIAFAPLFYFFTAVVPFLYIILGLRRKQRILLVIGLVCLACSGFTFQYYTTFLTGPQALICFGAAMILVSSWLIHYLKQTRYGISDDPETDHTRLLQIQALLAAEYFGTTTPPDTFQFGGGGEFSGGGAEGGY